MARHLPNLLCLLRLALTPVCVRAIVRGEYGVALAVFFCAGWTDFLDGWLARRFQWRSRLGAYLDPLADKTLMVAVFLALGVAGVAPWWLVALIIGRDLMILAGAALLYLHTARTDFPPRRSGKVSTTLQIAAAVTLLAWAAQLVAPWWRQVAITAAAAGTLCSGADYAATGWRMMRTQSIKPEASCDDSL